MKNEGYKRGFLEIFLGVLRANNLDFINKAFGTVDFLKIFFFKTKYIFYGNKYI